MSFGQCSKATVRILGAVLLLIFALGAAAADPPISGAPNRILFPQGKLNPLPLVLPSSATPAGNADLDVACRPGDDNRRSDLCAQWKAADSASKAAEWAVVSTILAAIGTVGLFLTLWWTRIGTQIAIRSADAARDATAADRAWILHKSPDAKAVLAHAPGTIAPAFQGVGLFMKWENFGRTPGTHLSTFFTHQITNSTTVPAFTALPPTENRSGFLGPGAIGSTGVIAIAANDYQAIRQGQMNLYVYSVALYRDIFQPEIERRTEMAGRIFFTGETNTPNGILIGVSIEFEGAQNTAT